MKMHTLLDLRGNIPSFIHLSDGKLADVHALDLVLPDVSTNYRCHRLCHFEMSLPSGSGGGRARSPGVAQRPTGARLSGARNRTTCLPSERPLARLVERLSRP